MQAQRKTTATSLEVKLGSTDQGWVKPGSFLACSLELRPQNPNHCLVANIIGRREVSNRSDSGLLLPPRATRCTGDRGRRF